jgi:hypothetical protein
MMRWRVCRGARFVVAKDTQERDLGLEFTGSSEEYRLKISGPTLPDFDFWRQNLVIGSRRLDCGKRVQSSTEGDSDTQPVIFLRTFIFGEQATASQAEAGAHGKAQADPPPYPDFHHPLLAH